MTHTNTEGLSDERLAEIVAYVDLLGPNSQPCVPGDVARSMAAELLSRRAANSAGGVEVKALAKIMSDALEPFGRLGSKLPDETDDAEFVDDAAIQAGHLRKAYAACISYITAHAPGGVLSEDNLSSPAVEAEPVAPAERLKLHRKIMGMIADKQRYAGVMIDGRELRVIAEALLDRAIEVERSSPVSAEVTVTALLDAYDAETTKTPLGHEDRGRGASSYNWRRSVVDDLRKLAVSLAALNGGRENG